MAPRQLYVLYTLAFAFCISAWKPQQFLGEFLDSRISDPHQRSSLVHALFESAEHQALGDDLQLQFDGSDRTGDRFNYKIGGLSLSFGQIVALGDLYANSAISKACPAQISDPDLSPTQKAQLFQNITEQVLASQSDTSELQCILNVILAQKTDTQSSEDPAQSFANGNAGIPNGWDAEFAKCTKLAYIWIALCNWDHFGQDAVQAYKVGHTYALSLAINAKDNWDLLDSYFYEAFAQHYLSDLFSTGHLRTPRRALHSNPAGLSFPGDECNRYMHDEDCANGLWVTNDQGESWPAYGDKQLYTYKNFVNRDHVIDTMQAGADEIFQVYRTKHAIPQEDYKPIRMIPKIPTDKLGNFVPMFTVQGEPRNGLLSQRSTLNARGDATVTIYNLTQAPWEDLASSIKYSAIVQDMYPRTFQTFTPEANVTQLRQINATHFLMNSYGPTWTKLHSRWPGQTAQRSWNMLSQHIVPIGPGKFPVTWQWANQVDAGIFSLFGTTQSALILLGVQNNCARSDTGCGATVLWNITITDTTPCSGATYTYGTMSLDSKRGLVRSCDGTPPRFELWTQTSSTSAPSLSSTWEASHPSSRIVLKSHLSYVDVAYFSSNSSYVWTFNTWTGSYQQRVDLVIVENGVKYAAQRILADESSDDQKFVRVSYGPGITSTEVPPSRRLQYVLFDTSTDIQIETLLLLNGSITTLSQQTYPTFDPRACTVSLTWFLTPLETSSAPSLIAYCLSSSPQSTVSTAVWSPLTASSPAGYQKPRIVSFGPEYKPHFNGAFAKDILTTTTRVFSPTTQLPGAASAGLLQLFDNYGILGARLLNPVRGDETAYAVVGQVPAIAGQLSEALGGAGDAGLGFVFG